jgi:hypothetical protein
MAAPLGRKAGRETGPDGKETGFIVCYPSDDMDCLVVSTPKPEEITTTGFLSFPEPTRFHDQLLIQATHDINQILIKLAQEAERDSRKSSLHLVLMDDGPMLVWVNSMVMPVDDIRSESSRSEAMS